MHDLPLISTIAVAFTAAWLLGLLAQGMKLSPIVGYILAGILIGPHTPGFVGEIELAQQLAEVGVILLMFGVGLHFDLKDLIAVRTVAIPGAVAQSAVATLLGCVVFAAFGLPLLSATILGMAMAVASTVLLMRVLIAADALNSPQGHIAVGWLLVEDLFTVVVLVLIPVLGAADGNNATTSGTTLWTTLSVALFKLALLVAGVLTVGSRVIPWVLVQVARLRSRELFTLTVLVFSIAVAAAAYTYFGASVALGAFLAGMVVGQSPVSHQAAADAIPLRDAFSVIFFVSVGMLFDPSFLIQQPAMVLAALGIIMIAKPITALAIVAVFGHSARTALTVALGLAQIGEFSFILSELARRHSLMPEAGHNVLVASAIISIIINPLLFSSLDRIEAWARRRPWIWSLLNYRAELRARQTNLAMKGQLGQPSEVSERLAIVIGYGPVGRSVHRMLADAGLTTVVIDLNMDTVSELTKQGQAAIYGDASHETILEQAGMAGASHLVITLPQSSARIAVITAARNLNANARILVRARYLRERDDLEKSGATAAVFEEAEAAVALARLVLADTGATRATVEQKARDLRLQLIVENMSNIRSVRVRNIMIPWTRVHKLSNSARRHEVLQQIAQHRFSRWPVTEPATGKVIGYLLAKDLIAQAATAEDWTQMVRPLRTVRSDDDIESTLVHLQEESASICIVQDDHVPIGIITLEDILEQVVGRIEDEYPHESKVSLQQAVQAGGVVMNLAGQTIEEVVAELVAAIPIERLPPEARVAEIAMEREREVSTDLGIGVAVPHARIANLAGPVVVIGRSYKGIPFSASSANLVRLVFLLVTPIERPDVGLSLLAEIARIAGDQARRDRMLDATSEYEVIELVSD